MWETSGMMMHWLLGGCVAYFAVPFLVLVPVMNRAADRRMKRTVAFLGAVIMAWIKPMEAVGAATLFVFFFWVLTVTGVWEPPTPENIRKLDAEIEAMESKP